MTATSETGINGLRFKIVLFDYVYMLGELLSSLSELHVKIQLVDRYCSKVLHNLRLLEEKKAGRAEIIECVRQENQELLAGLKRHNIFYDKYRMKMLSINHQGIEGEVVTEDTYNGSQVVVPVKQVVERLLGHMHDGTTVKDMGLFGREHEVMRLTSSMDQKPGETAYHVLHHLENTTQGIHVYVKKEKLVGVEYLSSGKPVSDPGLINQAESQKSDKDRFLNDPLIRILFVKG